MSENTDVAVAGTQPAEHSVRDPKLSRRERQIMDALYQLGRAPVAAIRDAIQNPPTYTALRTHLTILEKRGHVRYQDDGVRYIYEPVIPRDEMAKSVVKSVLQTFFDNSVEQIVATLIENENSNISDDQLSRIAAMIEQARKEGR